MLDAPVSGGVAGAERGSLTIMVGGARPLFDRYHPLFEAMGKTIHYVGGTGAGHTIKAINNMVSATTMAVTSEALALAVKAGIDVETALAVINSGTGRSWSSEYKFPTFVLNHAFNSGFSIGLMRKDVDIAIELGQEHARPPLRRRRRAATLPLRHRPRPQRAVPHDDRDDPRRDGGRPPRRHARSDRRVAR